jgi:hypothetical protein
VTKRKNRKGIPGESKQVRRENRRLASIQAVQTLVPYWAPGSALAWADVANLVGRDVLLSRGLLGHRTDCPRVPAPLSSGDALLVGNTLLDSPSGALAQLLDRYVMPVHVADVARELRCPQYIISAQSTISHDEYHELLDLRGTPVAWQQRLESAKSARHDAKVVRSAINEAVAAMAAPYAVVRDVLGLAAWQMELAFESGVFTSGLPSHSVLVEEYAAAVAAPDLFAARLAREEKINAGEVAKVLGVPRAHVDEMVADHSLRSCGVGQWKWGTFDLFRRGDVEDLVAGMSLRIERRKARQGEARRLGARRAARSRTQNAANLARARNSTQRNLIAQSGGGRPPLDQSLGLVGFWGELVSGHALDARAKAGRARLPETAARLRRVSDECYEAKNELSETLVLVKSTLVTWDFYDGGRLLLCDRCVECAHAIDEPLWRYKEGNWCARCTIDHHFSVLSCTITAGPVREITIPVPIAAAFVRGGHIASPSVERPARDKGQPRDDLPNWIRAVAAVERHDLSSLPVLRVTSAELRVYAPEDAIAALRAATTTLREAARLAPLT